MLFNFITLFPEKIKSYFADGLPGKAIQKGIFQINIVNLRDFSQDKFKRVDDTVYGGGPGMLLQVDPIDRALDSLGENKGKVILLSASGKTVTQKLFQEFLKLEKITLISGYYEGVDHRVTQHLVDIELSLGNFVLSSGDLSALCVSDAIFRLLPGFMGGGEDSLSVESHNEEGILEYPQYTKPSNYKGWEVPPVLLSGNHAEILKWREKNRKNLL